jgi:hypothetical protein
MKKILLVLMMSLCIVTPPLFAETYYWNGHTGFREFDNLESELLNISNGSSGIKSMAVPVDLRGEDFLFTIRVANLHSNHRRDYTYIDKEGNKAKCRLPGWGIYFTSEQGEVMTILLKGKSSFDLFGMQGDGLELSGNMSEGVNLFSVDCGMSLNAHDGLNTLVVKHEGDEWAVSGGSPSLSKLADFTVPFVANTVSLFVEQGGDINVAEIKLNIDTQRKLYSSHVMTDEDYASYFEKSGDPLEGFWGVYDRVLDEDLLRLGGDYKLAIIRSDKGYDLVYLSGAKVNSSYWERGMIKGKLLSDDYGGAFNVVWYDSQQTAMSHDIKAQSENGVMLTINFPYQSSQLRLHKVVSRQ